MTSHKLVICVGFEHCGVERLRSDFVIDHVNNICTRLIDGG